MAQTVNGNNLQIVLLDNLVYPIGDGSKLHVIILVIGEYHLLRVHRIKAKFEEVGCLLFAPFLQ